MLHLLAVYLRMWSPRPALQTSTSPRPSSSHISCYLVLTGVVVAVSDVLSVFPLPVYSRWTHVSSVGAKGPVCWIKEDLLAEI